MASPLLPLLRSRVQGDVLAWTFLHPDEEYTLTDLARRAGASVRAVHHEVERLVATGYLQDRRRGNLRLVRAETGTAVAGPLTDLLAVTFGPLPVMADLLAGVDGIVEAHVYGSWAARYTGEPGPVPEDVDVLIIGDADPDELDDIAARAETRLARPVTLTRVRSAAWQARDRAEPDDDPFLVSLRERPLVAIPIGAAGR
jgi:AraC-like DNA-binding protein